MPETVSQQRTDAERRARLREQFPHTQDTIYLNHAATSPLSRPVVDAIERYTQERHRTNIENFDSFREVVAQTRERAGRLLGTAPERVEFVPNTSSALGLLVQGLNWREGDRIAVPACEFPANVYPFLQNQKTEVDFIPHEEGTFTLEDMASTLTPETRLLSVSWVQFLSGFRADLAAIGALCQERNVIFCVDAIQGLGALRLDVEACGIDFLACGGHKWLMATQGIGLLYCSERLQSELRPPAGWLHGPVDWENFFDYELAFHPDARRFRRGTQNHIGIAALGAALALYFEAGPAWCERQVVARAQELADGLEELGLRRYGTKDPAHGSGIVTVKAEAPQALFEHLKQHGIQAALRNNLLRFAPSYYSSPEEIEHVLGVVDRYLSEHASSST